MQCDRKILIVTLCASLSLALATGGAHAACATLAGTWYFYDFQGESAAINTVNTSVVVGPKLTDKKTLETFNWSQSDKGFTNDTATVIQCTMTVKANGSFTAPCISYATDGTHNEGVTGKLALTAACDLSGTISAGDPTPVVIQGGHVNGNMGAGIATQGSRFHHFTVVKK